MRSIRKGNDVRNLEVLVSRLSVPVTNWDELLNLKVSCFEKSRKNYLIAPDVVYKEDGKLRLYFEGNKLSEGVYDLLITFSITDPVMPDAIEDKAIDIQNIFRIVPTTALEVDSQDPFAVDLNFVKDGLDYYHIWSQYNEGTIEDMFAWHRQPAADAAAEIRQQTNEFISESEQRIDGLIDEKTIEVDTLITESTNQVNALMDEMANHPTYIGQDHYVYIWNRDTQSYDKTDIYCKGDAFSISKVYPSIAAMEAEFGGIDTKIGSFVLIETGDNEDPDNSKLYVKTSTEWAYLTDLSGAIGFTGKTPQLSIGTVTTGAPGSDVTVTISEDGIDDSGNPKFKLNFAIPEGDPGKVIQFSAGEVITGEPGTSADVTLSDDGVDEQDNPKKKINFIIPRGDTGKSAYQDYFDNTTDEPKLSQAEWNVLQAEMPSKELERQDNEQTRIDNDNAREGKINDLKVATELNSHDITSLHNTLTSLNTNQESIITASGYQTVSLPKNAANGGMGVKLEGQSAENLVINGDFRSSNITGFKSLYTTANLSYNGKLVVTGNGIGNLLGVSNISSNSPANTGDKYYVKVVYVNKSAKLITSYKGGIGGSTSGTALIGSTLLVTQIAQNTRVTDTSILQITSAIKGNVLIVIRANAETTTGLIIEIEQMFGINLTATFGAGNEPDLATCDKMFADYFEGTANFLPTGRVRSVGKNLINSSKFKNKYIGTTPVPNTWQVGTDFIEMYTDDANLGCGLAQLAKIYAGTYYLKARSITKDAGTAGVSLYFRDKNNNNITFAYISTLGTFTITNEQASVIDKIIIYKGGGAGTKLIRIEGLQLERSLTSSLFEPYRESSLYLQSPVLRSNRLVKDEIRKGSNGYELVKRVGVGTLGANGIAGGDFEGGLIGIHYEGDGSVSTWTLNTSNQISGMQDGRLIVTTAPSASGRPAIQFGTSRAAGQYRRLSFDYKVNSGSPIVSAITPGAGTISINGSLSGIGKYELYYNCNGTQALIFYFAKSGLYDLQLDNIKDELINTPDGGATGSTATVIGSNIYYTLATPVITPIPSAGLLNSNFNGTVYHEPVIADAGIYSDSLTIQDTAHPIASLEKLIKREAGVEYLLDVSLAQMAPDGLSFTHPELADGDLVLFTYYYKAEGPNGKLTASFYNSNQVRIDPVTGKAYKEDWRVENGVKIEFLTEV